MDGPDADAGKALAPVSMECDRDAGAAYPVVDLDAVEALRSAIGVEQYGVMAQFVGECSRLLFMVALQDSRTDAAGIKRIAHKLARLFGQFGCTRAAGLAESLESAPSDAEVAAMTAGLIEAGTASLAALKARSSVIASWRCGSSTTCTQRRSRLSWASAYAPIPSE